MVFFEYLNSHFFLSIKMHIKAFFKGYLCCARYSFVLCAVSCLKRHNELSILINFLQRRWKYNIIRLCQHPFVVPVDFLVSYERELNCCRVIVHIARRYSLRNWVKQLTIGIQATSQAHLRECRRRSINTKDNRFWRKIPQRTIDYQYFPRSTMKENN